MSEQEKNVKLKRVVITIGRKGLFSRGKSYSLYYDDTNGNNVVLIEDSHGNPITNNVDDKLKNTLVYLSGLLNSLK